MSLSKMIFSRFGAFFFIALLSLPSQAIPVEGQKIMMSGVSPYSIEVGKKIYAEGGNVVDVAVGMILSMSVTTPYFSALGGGGFALVKLGKNPVTALDFREVAPQKTNPTFYLKLKKDASRNGGTAVGVPGIPAGLWALHQKYGKLKWSQLFVEPLKLAKNGFRVSGEWYKRTTRTKKRFDKAGLSTFFKSKGAPYKPGDIFKQPKLYQALRLFQKKGTKGFYEGPVATDIIHAVDQSQGVMTSNDLKSYKVRWLKPMQTKFEGYDIYLMPPPSSGGVVIASALDLIQMVHLDKYPYMSVDELHLLGQIEGRSFRGRALLGDPDFYKNPISFLLSKGELKKLAASISLKTNTQLEPLTPADLPKESHETTHISVMDHNGNAVSMTVTLNGVYGSAVVTSRYGIALNNEMDDFTTHPGQPNQFGLIQGKGNDVQPGKRPLSSMSPTLVSKGRHIVMAIGSPGGPRIISGVLQVLYRILDQHMDADAAIQAPRIHNQFLPRVLYVEKHRFSPDVLNLLRQRGDKLEEGWMGKVYVVRVNDQGFLEGAFDARGEGAAGGY